MCKLQGILLQWGRVLTNAETGLRNSTRMCVGKLGFNGAAFSRTRKPSA